MRSLCVFLSFAAACSSAGSSTKGQRGRASFAYLASPGCEDGCNLDDHAVAADGAHQLLSVTGSDFASVSSGTPAVASFTKTADGVAAVTATAGTTDLILLDGAGGEIDRVTVQVADVAHFDFTRGFTGPGPIVLENVAITAPAITKRDAGQRILLGSEAIHFAVSGTLTSLGPPPPSSATAPASIIESLIVQGTAGSGDLTGTNGTQSFDLPFTVVALGDLTRLDVTGGTSFIGSSGASVDLVATVVVSVAAGPVFGPPCSWSTSDPSVRVVPTFAGAQLDQPAASTTTLQMTKTGSYTATCTVGRLVGTIKISREG